MELLNRVEGREGEGGGVGLLDHRIHPMLFGNRRYN